MHLSGKQLEQCESSKWDFSDLNALFLNCTLKRTPELSHTEGLINISKAIMEKTVFPYECCVRSTTESRMVFTRI